MVRRRQISEVPYIQIWGNCLTFSQDAFISQWTFKTVVGVNWMGKWKTRYIEPSDGDDPEKLRGITQELLDEIKFSYGIPAVEGEEDNGWRDTSDDSGEPDFGPGVEVHSLGCGC